jgi:hypothetical protein
MSRGLALELRAEAEPELATSLSVEGETELHRMIRYGFDFRLILAMRELDEIREENAKLRRKLRIRR